MKIFVCSSKHAFGRAGVVIDELKKLGHEVTHPNNYEDPFLEERVKAEKPETHAEWKAEMFRLQEEKIKANDGILVFNVEKNGQQNYIGGATFLEVFKAWELGKKIYFYNPLPEGMLNDELVGMNPIVVHGDLSLVRD